MWIKHWLKRWLSQTQARHPSHGPARRRERFLPTLRRLEDRTLLTTLTASTVPQLIQDIASTNALGGSNTILLQATNGVAQFTLTSPISPGPAEGATGLPEIAANNRLTIVGNGATLSRGTDPATPTFR